jgi:predicted regulator of Ras-like GTPase activity (Roadblock/LC7/MglB family)
MEKVKAAAVLGTSFMSDAVPPLPSSGSVTPPSWNAPIRSPLPMSESPAFASPPAVSTPPAPQPPGAQAAPSFPTFDPSAALDELVGTVDGVRSAVLASVDGFGVARSGPMTDEASHPAMLAAALGLAHQLVVMGGGRQLRQLVVDHDGGLMLVRPIGDQRVLAVLTTVNVDQRRIHSFVEAWASWLVGATL